MPDDRQPLDIPKVIQQSTRRVTLQELQQKGFQNVKILDEQAIQELVAQAVDKVVSSQTAEERARVLADSRKELDRLMREHKAEGSRANLLEADKNELIEQVEALQKELQLQMELEEGNLHKKVQEGLASMQAQVEDLRTRHQAAQGELQGLRAESARLKGEHARGAQEVERAYREVARVQDVLEKEKQRADGTELRLAGLEKSLAEERGRQSESEKSRAALEKEVQSARKELGALRMEAVRLRTEHARGGKDLEDARRDVAAGKAKAEEAARLREELAERRKGEESALEKTAAGEERARTAERELAAARARLEEAGKERAQALAEAARLQAEVAEHRKGEDSRREKLAGEEERARDAEKEAAAARARLEEAGKERARALVEAAEAGEERARLQAELERLERDRRSQQEGAIVVTTQLQEIEERYRTEQTELASLRTEILRERERAERLDRELSRAREEILSLRELAAREQEQSRASVAQEATLRSQAAELEARAGDLDRELQALRLERGRLEERVAASTRQTDLERLLADARAAAQRSREAAEILEGILARRTARRGAASRGGAAFDGQALLDRYFRRLRLRELFAAHVPMRDGRASDPPADLLAAAIGRAVGGDAPAPGRRVEFHGPAERPRPAELRRLLAGLSPLAVREIGRVHDGLRLQFSPLPPRPCGIVFDVGVVGTARPAWAAFDPDRGEFWDARPARRRAKGSVPLLKALLARVPATFARGRIRLRLGPEFLGEAVVRFLESRGCGYAIAAPDAASLRRAASACAFRRLSGGWEAGEFSRRLHPIRKTLGRFLVLRRRPPGKGNPWPAPTFREGRRATWVFAVDGRATPWRTMRLFSGREASLARAGELLAEFCGRGLAARRRRSRAAVLACGALASDLAVWFRRRVLPPRERGRSLGELREGFLMGPPPARNGSPTLLVLPRRDARRRLFERAARALARLRPARPFRLPR